MSYTREGYSTLTPVFISKNAQATLDGFLNALGIEVRETMDNPETGTLMHACLKIGNSTVFLGQETPEQGLAATERQELYLYVENAETAFNKAVAAGWEGLSEAEDMLWGDRIAAVKDIDGNTWKFAQAIRDVSPEELEEAMKAMSTEGMTQ